MEERARTLASRSRCDLAAREAVPTKSYPSLGLLPTLRREAAGPGDDAGVPEGIAIGDPERVLRACKNWESAGVDRINFLLNALETIPQKDVLESLRTFARHVMPHFRDENQSVAAAGGR